MQELRRCRWFVAGWLLVPICGMMLLAGCSDTPVEGAIRFERTFNFANGDPAGWSAGFADYPSDTPDAPYELVFAVRDLPPGVGSGQALFLSGHNRSDDLFMFLKRELTGLEPETEYDVVVRVQLASDAPSGCAGIGGAPGEAVYLKVGAVTEEPKVVVRNNFYTFTADKGRQSENGRDAVIVGDIANGNPCTDDAPYALIERHNRGQPLTVTSSKDGTFWVFVGTDSGYEGLTSLYYAAIEVTAEKR